jgi:hypothetical protein
MSRLLLGLAVWAVLIAAVVGLYHLSRQRDRRIAQASRDSGGHAHLMERPRRDTCPQCGATEQQWCHDGCPLLDPMDWR